MIQTNALADLDELVLLCRDEKARLYIVEAVACYRSGAYRSAIVATWVAVCYDIIDKLRELALAGDSAAEQKIKEIEQARASNNLLSALKFEREILNLAKDQFELISPLEHIDLLRLQEDRNRCAHPSLISEDQGFNPSGELARLHIRSAVLHLLQHQPVQGKYALERLLREVNSEYFPDQTDKAAAVLSIGPLKRPRDALVRNFMIVLMKDILNPAVQWKPRSRALAALGAVKRMHRGIFQKVMTDQLPLRFRTLPDTALIFVVKMVVKVVDFWDILPQDMCSKIERFVADLPTDDFHSIDTILEYGPLKESAKRRVRAASREEILNSLFFDLPPIVGDEIVDRYLTSRNFAQANEWGLGVLDPYATELSADQQRRILTGIHENAQVLYSNALPAVLRRLRETNKIPRLDFERLLQANGLEQYVADPGEPAL